ncbi:unnamed protein product [Lepidochelys olivacea]
MCVCISVCSNSSVRTLNPSWVVTVLYFFFVFDDLRMLLSPLLLILELDPLLASIKCVSGDSSSDSNEKIFVDIWDCNPRQVRYSFKNWTDGLKYPWTAKQETPPTNHWGKQDPEISESSL